MNSEDLHQMFRMKYGTGMELVNPIELMLHHFILLTDKDPIIETSETKYIVLSTKETL